MYRRRPGGELGGRRAPTFPAPRRLHHRRLKTTSEVDDAIARTGRAPGARRSGSAPLVGARPALRCLLHGAPRRHDHDRGAALDRSRSRLLQARPGVGAERLRPDLRRPAPARRTRGRPARPASRVHGRCPALHGRVARVRAGLVAGGAPGGPRGPGRRRRDHDPDRPVDHLHDLSRGFRAEQGARDLGRTGRHRRYDGVADRRPARRRPRLAVDLLHQRPRRPGRARAVARAPAREPGRADPAKLRPRRGAHHHRRAGPARLRGRRGAERRLGRRADHPAARRRRPCWSPPSR